MAKDPCETCREQVILELFARIGGRTLGQKDCENCNVRRESGKMANTTMMFPNTVREFMEQYKMVDTDHIYSNGIEYVPIFRMEQWFAHQADTPRWIPVTERLPEKYGQYLVTFIPSGGTLWTKVLIAFYSDLMGIAKPSFHIGEVGKDRFGNINEQVIAWMPLPTPYKGGEEE